MTSESISTFTFPVGYHRFHKGQLFNYQLNRWHASGYARFEDMKEAGENVKTFQDWKSQMQRLAEIAVSENRLMNAAFYYRAAEFYTFHGDPDKERFYEKFIVFFEKAFQQDEIERFEAPYNQAFLPVMKIPAMNGKKKGAIVLHGGFDSMIEEFYSWMRFFSDRGYEVIAFEGPGQGAARSRYGLALDLEWEKPAKAILDFFKLDDVTLLGISMGGWLGMRAAAFEPRITRVIATGHAVDYMKSMNAFFRWLHLWFFEHYRGWMERMAEKKFLGKRENIASWVVKHLMYITRKEKPLDALEVYLQMNEQNIHSECIKQDVLLLLGKGDHFIPFKMLEMQVKALTNARSITTRIFTEEEHAQNHCQVGNIGLALEAMVKWLDEKTCPDVH